MPLTACVFMLEISRFSTELFYPMALAMGTALITQRFLQRKYECSRPEQIEVIYDYGFYLFFI